MTEKRGELIRKILKLGDDCDKQGEYMAASALHLTAAIMLNDDIGKDDFVNSIGVILARIVNARDKKQYEKNNANPHNTITLN